DLHRPLDGAARMAAQQQIQAVRIRVPRRRRADPRLHQFVARAARQGSTGQEIMIRKSTLMTFAGAALALALAASSPAAGAAGGTLPAVVKTAMGSVRGAPAAMPGVMVYKGMPFGAAPVGALRFREAQPAKPWSGVLDGTKWGNACIQPSGK